MGSHGRHSRGLPILIGAIIAGSLNSGPARAATIHAASEQAERIIAVARIAVKSNSPATLFRLGVHAPVSTLIVTGMVDSASAHTDLTNRLLLAKLVFEDRIEVLPEAALGSNTWGIGFLSVTSAREEPEHKAEMGTQVRMGEVIRVLKKHSHGWLDWFLVQCADGYVAWVEDGAFTRCGFETVQAWTNAPRVIVTAREQEIVEWPSTNAAPIGESIMGGLLEKITIEGDWIKVRLTDGRVGFVPGSSVQDYNRWRALLTPSADGIERTARLLLGRPYLWGGLSTKGFDCSGFTQHVFRMNGIDLPRNSSQQAQLGDDVPLDGECSQLKKGDLLFFGRRSTATQSERVVHVGIYLGQKLFIHSSEMVRISSLDPDSPIRDDQRIRSLIRARRVLR